MLLQKPVVSGHYTSGPYHNMLQPLDHFVRAVLESAVRLGVLTAQLLSEQCTDACLDAVQAQIKQLEALRFVTLMIIIITIIIILIIIYRRFS